MIDYIHPNDLNKYSVYWKYLNCYHCKELMVQPVYCVQCKGITTCSDCKCNLHEIKNSRHISVLFDKIKFQCKYCDKANIHYNDLINHEDNECLMNPKIPSTTNQDDCEMTNENNKEITKKNDQIQSSNDIQLQIQNFYSYAKEVIYEIELVKKEKYEDSIIELNNIIQEKIQGIQNVINDLGYLNTKLCYNRSSNDAIENSIDNAMKYLKKHEEELDLKHNQLDTQINTLIEQVKSHLPLKRFNIKNHPNLEKYIAYQGLIKENDYMKSCLISTSLQSTQELFPCALCGDTSTNDSMYKCHKCLSSYCLIKCSKKCSEIPCQNFLCPKDTIQCSICHQKVYCDQCVTKCFYLHCSNYFCHNCFLINRHQSKDKTINDPCNNLPCESCHYHMCIMTSLNCGPCKKRYCLQCFKLHKH